MEKKMYDLKINERFATALPPLKECERELLEWSILEAGCLDPLIVWNGVIVDGHQRYSICKEHQIPFAIKEIEFYSVTTALVWIVKSHLGKRNLTAFQKVEMMLPLEKALRAEAKRRQNWKSDLSGRMDDCGRDTREILANLAGVSRGAVCAVKKILELADKDTLRRVRNGEISIHGAYMILMNCRSSSRSASEPITLAETAFSPAFKATAKSALPEIDAAVKELLSNVTMGDASPKMIIEKLTRVSEMIGEEMRG